MLSRGSLTAEGARGLPLGFQFFGGVSGVYDSGMTPVSVDSTGKLVNLDHLFGVEAGIGVNGTRRWAHSSLGLSYNGTYRHYNAKSYYDGSDNVLTLDGRTDLNAHVTLVTRNAVGSVSRTVSGFGGLVATPDSLLGIPSNEIFDNRTYFLQTTDEIMWRKSARLSFVAGGDGFFVRRQSSALVGTNGYGAHGNVAYRLDRSQTIDAAYVYMHFDYPRAFGESDLHQFTMGYARQLNRSWEAAVQAGAYKVDTIGVTTVALDPALAALFGYSATVQAFHKVSYLPLLGAQLRAKYKRSYFNAGYGRQPSPGNGVYLTSTSQNLNIGGSFETSSRLSFQAGINANQYSSVGQQNLGTFRTIGGGAGVSYRIGESLHSAVRFDLRQAEIDLTNGYRRLGTRITVTLNYSPGNHPLALWR